MRRPEDKNRFQMELALGRDPEPDRNHRQGGRSFYFFDFDDNVIFLTTPIFVFHKETGEELALTTGEYARWSHAVGRAGPYRDFEVRFDDRTGSFRRFRDHDNEQLAKLNLKQPFIEDLAQALGQPDFHWKGPSWHTFYHATFNARPLSVITARGHHPETIKQGISLMANEGHLAGIPNYLSIYPVSYPGTRDALGDLDRTLGTAELKRRAIMASVEKAMEVYGVNAHHRFGMSDDDPRNIELIIQAMTKMKEKYPENSFFVIDTHLERYVKQEVFANRVRSEYVDQAPQLELF